MNADQKTRQIIELLRLRHSPPEWATFVELSLATGFTPQRADVFAFNLWPSKKFWRVGYEVKVSRADFANEMKKPDKRKAVENLANECFFVAPAGLLKVDEVPEGWGLIEKTKGGLRRKKHAMQREPRLIPNTFVAAIARRSVDPPTTDLPEVYWKYAGQDLTYEQLIETARNEIGFREQELLEEGRKQISEDQKYKDTQQLRVIIQGHLGWQYGDPDKLLEWFNNQNKPQFNRNLKLKLERAKDALKVAIATLE